MQAKIRFGFEVKYAGSGGGDPGDLEGRHGGRGGGFGENKKGAGGASWARAKQILVENQQKNVTSRDLTTGHRLKKSERLNSRGRRDEVMRDDWGAGYWALAERKGQLSGVANPKGCSRRGTEV